MAFARRVDRVWPVIWFVIVAADILVGVTATKPGVWAGVLLTLVFFTVSSWRFFVPSLSVAPSPAAGITALGTVAVAVRGIWIDGSLIDAFTDPRAWGGLVLAIVAVTAAVAAPFTGVATPMTGDMIFPLRDGRWRVVEGQGRILNHHWPAVRQREALDLVRIAWSGRSRHGVVGGENEDFHAFGTVVVAPCAGTVIRTFDGLPDGVLDPSRPAGNNVIIDNGHEHILLAHLRSGTVAVSTGDEVRAGDRLGEVGNSGNSSEPHLHIHAERDGQPLRIRFTDVGGRFGRGRIVSTRQFSDVTHV
ncbi:peptidoglycan DD-metalloendopeptidase family protein [Williamsia sp. M5A3_1d]